MQEQQSHGSIRTQISLACSVHYQSRMASLLTYVILFSLFTITVPLPLPFNQYAYMLARDKIKQHNRAVQAKNNLNAKETIVNLYLELLRVDEFIETEIIFIHLDRSKQKFRILRRVYSINF
jgi:hypothetical protein